METITSNSLSAQDATEMFAMICSEYLKMDPEEVKNKLHISSPTIGPFELEHLCKTCGLYLGLRVRYEIPSGKADHKKIIKAIQWPTSEAKPSDGLPDFTLD